MAKTSPIVDQLLQIFAPLGEVTAKPMFGGFGVFGDGKMFALVTRAGVLHLKTDDQNRAQFVETGMSPHGKMPYFTVPEAVSGDPATLLTWAGQSLEAARRSPRKQKRKKPAET